MRRVETGGLSITGAQVRAVALAVRLIFAQAAVRSLPNSASGITMSAVPFDVMPWVRCRPTAWCMIHPFAGASMIKLVVGLSVGVFVAACASPPDKVAGTSGDTVC